MICPVCRQRVLLTGARTNPLVPVHADSIGQRCPMSMQFAPAVGTCLVEGCKRPARSRRADYCETHYYRLRRTGSTNEPARISGRCVVDGCMRDATHGMSISPEPGRGYCRMHYLRIKKHGDPEFAYVESNVHMWTGDEATYGAVHQRIYGTRGKASYHQCVDCSDQAQHWSYDRTDREERVENGKPYSVDVQRYVPRCVACHKLFDLRFVRWRNAGDRKEAAR